MPIMPVRPLVKHFIQIMSNQRFLFFFFLLSFHGANSTFSSICTESETLCNGVKINYPFWTVQETTNGTTASNVFCGYQGFGLRCSADNKTSPILTLPSDTYYVKDINYKNKSITLVDVDANVNASWCPRLRHNVTVDTLPLQIQFDSLNLTFYFNCNPEGFLSKSWANLISCLNTTGSTNSSYVSEEEAEGFDWTAWCEDKVVATVKETEPLKDHLVEGYAAAIKAGFGLDWRVPENCSKCESSGGRCGVNNWTKDFVCFCTNSAMVTDGRTCRGGGEVSLFLIGLIPALLTALVLAVITSIFLARRRNNLRHHSPTTSQIGENNFNVENFINGIAPRKYTYSEVKRMSNSFSIKLGQGGYGSVYKGRLKDGRPVAVKILNVSKESSGEDFFNEVASISRTAHVNVVALLGFCYERKRRALVYEFMPNGSLDKFITTKGASDRNSTLECKVLYQITLGIARGLEYLHRGCNTRIVHFDIKPHNILLDQDLVPKISDFGLAKLWQGKESMVSMQGTRGTIGYIAPEVFCRNFGGVSHKSDVYSYGMLVLDMVCGRYNFDARVSHTSDAYFPDWIYRDYLQLGKDITLNEIATEEEEEITRKMIIVGLWCIQNRPSDRPSIKEVIEMLEGSTQALQVPLLKPFQASPERLPELYSTTSSSNFNGNEEISILEPEAREVN